MSPIILGMVQCLRPHSGASVAYILLFIGTSCCWLSNVNETILTDPHLGQFFLS